jgi:prepilin-type N-terminal cleavage/methylation domain-containing protein
MLAVHKTRSGHQDGFSILEMMFATLILLIGLVAVAQLVPASILMNYRNRTDTSSLVFAQRQLDQFLEQPLSATSVSDPTGIACPVSITCELGDPTKPNTVVGNNVVSISGQALVDFSPSTGTTGYSFTYQDPNDPGGTTYDVRWAVITSVNNVKTITSKRFFLGVRQQGGNGYFQPVTLDTMVER